MIVDLSKTGLMNSVAERLAENDADLASGEIGRGEWERANDFLLAQWFMLEAKPEGEFRGVIGR